MAGEIYIARQDTLENVQSTVNEIDANVDTANSTLGNFAGGGTDSVVTELNALKQAVAALTTKTDGLQTDVTNIKTDVGTIETTVEQIAGQGGGITSCIRHIQKVEGEVTDSGKEISLTGFTDFNKMIALVNGNASIYSFTKNSIWIFKNGERSSEPFYLQVIEFY